MTKIQLPPKVSYIIHTLEAAGFEAYAVGGCVRDTLLGRLPDDWDITTSAKPLQVKEVFKRTIDTGIQHGTVTVMLEKEGFEVTTYRIDGEYEDSRHPKEVIFTTNLIEDLKRRDFTINAMAYNDRSGIVDAFCGMEDLEKGIVRCVGEPTERFTEDALRMMRAVRFSAQLGFSIDEKTCEAITILADTLKNISAERIQTELIKLLVSPHPDYIKRAYELGITEVILPELDRAFETTLQHADTVGDHAIRCLLNCERDKALRIAALFHDFAKADCEAPFAGHEIKGEEKANQILRRLKFDVDTITKVRKYIKFHGEIIEPEKPAIRKMIHLMGEESFPMVMKLKQANLLANGGDDMKQAKLDEINRLYQEILLAGDCVSLKTLALSGKDLLAHGIPQGKEIGNTLNRLLEDVLVHPEHNTKEYLISKL